MRLISWNVNGIRAVKKKGFEDFIDMNSFDILCIQEIKADDEIAKEELTALTKDHHVYWNSAEKKGYSGVAAFSKVEPLGVMYGMDSEFDDEGRVLTLEFEKFYLVNAYFVNSKRGLARLDGKIEFNRLLFDHCEELRKRKPVVICGDFNVAHKEIDLKNPKSNERNAGFTVEERDSFDAFLKKGYIDAFREFEKGPGHYTWWSYMFNARAKDIGWRIDYFVVSNELKDNLSGSAILKEVMGSDHCPIDLNLDL